MKSNNLKDFRQLSNIVSNNKDLLVQSTKASFDENAYRSELWKYSNKAWKKYKDSKTKDFSTPQYSNNKKSISYIRTEKNSKKETISSLCVQNGNSIKVVFETKDSIQSYLWSSSDKFIYVVTKEWDKNFYSLEKKEKEPIYIKNLPFRFDTQGIIYNKRSHIYKVNTSSSKSSKIVDGYKDDYLSKNLNYLSNIDEIMAHPRGFEPLAS